MTAQRLNTYVVNLKRRADRRARMERVLPAGWDVKFTSDWDGPMDGQAIDPDNLPDFGLYPWEIKSDNPWWNRPLKLGEIGCAISHWMCWQHAAAQVPARAGQPPQTALAQVAFDRHGQEQLTLGEPQHRLIAPQQPEVLGGGRVQRQRPVTRDHVASPGPLLSPRLRAGQRMISTSSTQVLTRPARMAATVAGTSQYRPPPD